jgi:hypothetical protein
MDNYGTHKHASALGKNDPFMLTKSDPHQKHDLPVGKEGSDIIHAASVRVNDRCRPMSGQNVVLGRPGGAGHFSRAKYGHFSRVPKILG